MKFAERPTQSAEYLRQAIPLMVKYKIPPNPLNYALWYTYVSQQSPQLNLELDKVLETYGTCPTLICEKMFKEHLLKDELNSADNFQLQAVSLVNDLHKNAGIASQCAIQYQEVLVSSLDALKEQDSQLSKENIIENLAMNTHSMNQSNLAFQQQIKEAQAEIQRLKEELNNTAHDSRIDQDTKLFNKEVFAIEIEQLIQLNADVIASVAIFELDQFQEFNLTFGEKMGDKIILFVANLLKNHCPSPSLAIRLLGPRFAMILFGADSQQAIETSEALRKKIESIRLKPKDANRLNHTLTASFGIAQKQADDTSESLIDRVLEKLAIAKKYKGNRLIS